MQQQPPPGEPQQPQQPEQSPQQPKPLPLSLLTAVFQRPPTATSGGYWKPPQQFEIRNEHSDDDEEGEPFQLPATLDKIARRRQAVAMERLDEYRQRNKIKCWHRFLTIALIMLAGISILGAIATIATFRVERAAAPPPATPLSGTATAAAAARIPEVLVAPEAFTMHSDQQQSWLMRQLDPYSEYSNSLPPEIHSELYKNNVDLKMMNVDVHAACRSKIFGMSCQVFDVVLAMAIYEFNIRFSCKYLVTYGHLRRLDPPGIDHPDDWRPPLGFLDFYTTTPEDFRRAQWQQLRIFGLFGSKMTVTNGSSVVNRPLIVDAPSHMAVFRYGYAYPTLKNGSFEHYFEPFSQNLEVIDCLERNVTNYVLRTAVRYDDNYYEKFHEMLLYGILLNNAKRIYNHRNFFEEDPIEYRPYFHQHMEEARESVCRGFLLTREVKRHRLQPWRTQRKLVTDTGIPCMSESVIPIGSSKLPRNVSEHDVNEEILMRYLSLHFNRVRGNVLSPARTLYDSKKKAAYMFADYVEREKANATYLYEYLKLRYRNDRVRTIQEFRSWLPLNSMNAIEDSESQPWRMYLSTPIMRQIRVNTTANFDRYYREAGITSQLPPGELMKNEPGVVIPIVGSKIRHMLAILKFGVCKFVQDETTTNSRRWINMSFSYDAPPAKYELSDGTIIEHDRRMRYTLTHADDDTLHTADLDELAIRVCALEDEPSDIIDLDPRRPNVEYTDRSPFNPFY